MNDSPVLLAARGIIKEYTSAAGSLEVLKGIDLELRAGETLAVMGASGVGKSTLLNILGLLDRPTSGTLKLNVEDGRTVDTAALSRSERARIRNRYLGFVFQFYHLLPDLNVLENVLLPAMISTPRRDYARERATFESRARELLEQVHIEDRERHLPNQLSGGERQRVAIARALMNQPRLVLCDEPTGNLDTETSDQIHQLFSALNRSLGTTFLMVTHDQSLADRAERRLSMVDGRFEEYRDPR